MKKVIKEIIICLALAVFIAFLNHLFGIGASVGFICGSLYMFIRAIIDKF